MHTYHTSQHTHTHSHTHTGNVIESEGNDRADINLPGNQLQLLKDTVSAAGSSEFVSVADNDVIIMA